MNRIERLIEIVRKPRRVVIGMMTGTSVDGIDAAVVSIEGAGKGARPQLLAFHGYPFPQEFRTRVFRLFDRERARVDEICNLDFLLGELFAEAVRQLLRETGMRAEQIDVIGTAGQTIWHDPLTSVVQDPSVGWLERPLSTRSTLAIGQSAVIAERTGIVTVGDLRVRDVAAGGQGAPLMAYADWILLAHESHGRCIQNIGGIGNVTYLPPGAGIEDVLAFDTGPGNMVIDALTEVATDGRQRFDRDGELARSGTVRTDLLDAWLDDAYFAKQPPKTTGREHFGVQFATRVMTEAQGAPLEDLIATATALTAESIVRSYADFVRHRGPIDEVIVGGGGAKNPVLMERLKRGLAPARVLTHEDVGLNSEAKEALGIALIANDAVLGLDTNVSGATGGTPTVLGKINL